MSIILTCNAGSSNIKLAAFDADTGERKAHSVTHSAAETMEWMCSVGEYGVAAVGHRIVHGGQHYTHPALITNDVLRTLKNYIPLAPLHQPIALKWVEETQKLYPNVPHIACFDTAFHHTVSESERRFPIPRNFYEQGIIRYGFHGLSYQYIVSILPEHVDTKNPKRLVIAHLGGGSSACAVSEGRSVASTMGFSTLDGMMMGTRSGALDPGVILHLLQEKNMSATDISDLLYHQSGLKGVSGISGDMRELEANSAPEAKEAIALYCHCAAKQIAGLLPAIQGMDALVFTGGIGEHSTIVRDRIVQELRWVGDFAVYVIPTNEEKVIAHSCQEFL